MGRPVHRTRNRRCVHGSWVNICKKYTIFLTKYSKKNIFSLLFQWPTTTLTNPSSVLVPWPLRLTSCRRRALTPVPTTLTKWLLSLFRISTIRVSLWGSRSESHHKNWINGIWCLIIHAHFFVLCFSCHSWSSVSVTSSSAYLSRTLRRWTPAYWRANQHLAKSKRYWKENRNMEFALLCHIENVNVHINQPLFWHITSQIEIGLLVGNSQVIFEKSESSCLTLVGECYHT